MKRWKNLLLAVVLAASAVPFSSGPSFADSGFCGVGSYGPAPVTGSGIPDIEFGYLIHNKCANAYSFAIHFPALGSSRDSRCETVPAGNYMMYATPNADNNWTIINCSPGIKMAPNPSVGADACGHRLVQSVYTEEAYYGYTITNPCGGTVQNRLYFPAYNYYSACVSMAAYSSAFFATYYATDNWVAQRC